MDLSNEEKNNLIRKLLLSRTRVLAKYGFLGLLLMHMKMALDESIETAATDAEYIYFSPKFLNELSDNELDFILMHEILHVVLKHCFRDGERNPELFNIACDIVINSIILQEHGFDLKAITLDKYGTSMHIAPNGKEGCNYTAEEVYEMLEKKMSKKGMKAKKGSGNNSKGSSSSSSDSNDESDSSGGTSNSKTIDDHSKWKEKSGETKDKEAEWDNRIYEAVKAIERQNEALGAGDMPAYIERLVTKLTTPQIDWRYVLNEFIQEEINDYTFLPPDYRYSGDFFLPSYSDKDDIVKDVLFMIDTSGSMTNEMIAYAFSEVYGAISMFDGKLSGKLGFFDYIVHNVVDFEDVSDIEKIKPMGGGGTSFESVFEYVDRMDEPPIMIIILTDGEAPYPKLDSSYNIPILWLINNDKITPPYGKVARIKIPK
ncbi:MAG: hypothetical protein IJB21_04690 [Bacilli bacterium]|nr:hypothetical protein [Bacilli bacterium]